MSTVGVAAAEVRVESVSVRWGDTEARLAAVDAERDVWRVIVPRSIVEGPPLGRYVVGYDEAVAFAADLAGRVEGLRSRHVELVVEECQIAVELAAISRGEA